MIWFAMDQSYLPITSGNFFNRAFDLAKEFVLVFAASDWINAMSLLVRIVISLSDWMIAMSLLVKNYVIAMTTNSRHLIGQ